jgi:hypothetical protein
MRGGIHVARRRHTRVPSYLIVRRQPIFSTMTSGESALLCPNE